VRFGPAVAPAQLSLTWTSQRSAWRSPRGTGGAAARGARPGPSCALQPPSSCCRTTIRLVPCLPPRIGMRRPTNNYSTANARSVSVSLVLLRALLPSALAPLLPLGARVADTHLQPQPLVVVRPGPTTGRARPAGSNPTSATGSLALTAGHAVPTAPRATVQPAPPTHAQLDVLLGTAQLVQAEAAPCCKLGRRERRRGRRSRPPPPQLAGRPRLSAALPPVRRSPPLEGPFFPRPGRRLSLTTRGLSRSPPWTLQACGWSRPAGRRCV
jgi:hypothetical protein